MPGVHRWLYHQLQRPPGGEKLNSLNNASLLPICTEKCTEKLNNASLLPILCTHCSTISSHNLEITITVSLVVVYIMHHAGMAPGMSIMLELSRHYTVWNSLYLPSHPPLLFLTLSAPPSQAMTVLCTTLTQRSHHNSSTHNMTCA